MRLSRALSFLVLSLSLSAPAAASPKAMGKLAPKAKPKAAKAHARASSKGARSTLGDRLAPGPRAQATAKHPALARALERAHQTFLREGSGLYRDPRYREPHQQAILKAVSNVLRAAPRRVRAGESPQLVEALDQLRSFRNAHLGDPRGIVPSRERIDRDFMRMVPHLKAVFHASGLESGEPPIPARSGE